VILGLLDQLDSQDESATNLIEMNTSTFLQLQPSVFIAEQKTIRQSGNYFFFFLELFSF